MWRYVVVWIIAVSYVHAVLLYRQYTCIITNMYSSFFLGKVTALGVLCCFALFVCLTMLASFFLPSHLSFKNMYRRDHVW